MENLLNTRNDELVLLYINYAFEKLNNALIRLRSTVDNVSGDIEGAFDCINESIVDNDFYHYLNNSTILTAQEIFTVKQWLNKIKKIIRFINQQATINPQAELQRGINNVLSDEALRAVKDKLADAVNQKRS